MGADRLVKTGVRFIGGSLDGQCMVVNALPDIFRAELSPTGIARVGYDRLNEFVKMDVEEYHLVRRGGEAFYVEAGLVKMAVELKVNPLPENN